MASYPDDIYTEPEPDPHTPPTWGRWRRWPGCGSAATATT